MTWIDMARVAVAPTLDAETLRSRAREFQAADADERPRLKAGRARPHLGEQVCRATPRRQTSQGENEGDE
jgi:hypothetical protein